MGLESLSIIFCLHIICNMFILSEEFYLFLPCQHWPNGKENFDLIVKAYIRIFKFFTSLKQAVSQVKVIICIFMESI